MLFDLLPKRNEIDGAWDYIVKNLYNSKTRLLYDHAVESEEEFASADECARSWPNACGYGTNMDDCMINGGTMLAACVSRYEHEPSDKLADFTRSIAEGLLLCAEVAKDPGFIPRGITPRDCKSHYIDSSRDQYTMFVYGLHRYLNSDICTSAHKKRISDALVAVARRAEKNVTAENGYDMLREDGGKTLNTVLWGPELGNHEMCRLPMIYIAAYEASGDKHWLGLYRSLRTEAVIRSLPMSGYGQLYTMQQMQCSLRVCYELETDADFKARYEDIMTEVADYCNNKVALLEKKLPETINYNDSGLSFRERKMLRQERYSDLEFLTPEYPDSEVFWLLQDAAIVLIVTSLCPGYEQREESLKFFTKAFGKINLKTYARALPIHYMDAYFGLKKEG